MRIIAGKLKGTNLYLAKNTNTRPLKDITRESIFNLLIHSNKISFKFEKSNILDLYSGTGSFGLECISRGAQKVFFVENEKEAIKTLEKNINKLKIKKTTKIFSEEVFKLLENKYINKINFDLIFCDPPFKMENVHKLIQLLFDSKLLIKTGIIILHRNKIIKEELPNFFEIIEERNYGISKIIFGKFLT
tara:strand:+ start:1727 stop:2296 length:570 start_codon:yes stop_codon:yes gene_type:complete